MNLKLLEIVICPYCKSKIALVESNREQDQNISDGIIKCNTCKNIYPICDGIPDFLPQELIVKGENSEVNKNIQVKQANIIYHDAIAKDYEKDISTFAILQSYTRLRIAEVLDYIKTNTDGELVLDLGCGTGNLLSITQKYFCKSIGIDISKGMLSVAKNRGFEVMHADIENVPIADRIADSVTCFSVLHHLYEPAKLFREAFRLLKPSGILYTDYDPNHTSKILQRSWLFSFAKKIFEILCKDKSKTSKNPLLNEAQKVAEYHHNIEKGLDPSSLRTQLKNIGFKNIKIIQHGNCVSLKKNTFRHIPITSKIEIVLKFLISWKLNYSYLAPQFLILAEK